MKKQHDAAGLANELEGASAFFQASQPTRPQAETPPHRAGRAMGDQTDTDPSAATDRALDRSPDRPAAQPAGRSIPKRQTQRRAFEFYRDQLETFKAWSAVDIAEGGEGNMSDWAREAFDDYIAKRNGDDRTTERGAERSVDRRDERER